MLQFRIHHFLCTLCFQGKGYSPSFIRNYKQIVDRLKSAGGDETPIEAIASSDAICKPCPHKRGSSCASAGKITQLDNAHAKVLELKEGDVITWGEAKQRIAEKIDIKTFKAICAPCDWQKLGICEAIVSKLSK